MTHSLVPSDRVEGVSVYGRDGERIGTIERLMLDTQTGKVAYAVVRCGGFLSPDRHYYPIAWDSLRFDLTRKAFEAATTLDVLRGGQSELDGEAFDWGDRSPGYRHPHYWAV